MDSTQNRRARFEAVADEVFEPLQRFLRRRIRGDQAEEVLSETMLTVWRRLDDLPAVGALPWCYAIARRTMANARRGEQRRLRLVQRLESEPSPRSETDPAEAGPDADLAAAMEQLSGDDRELLRLWAWEQLEPREIARVLDTTVNAATLRLSRARARLGKHLMRQNSDPSGHERMNGTRKRR